MVKTQKKNFYLLVAGGVGVMALFFILFLLFAVLGNGDSSANTVMQNVAQILSIFIALVLLTVAIGFIGANYD